MSALAQVRLNKAGRGVAINDGLPCPKPVGVVGLNKAGRGVAIYDGLPCPRPVGMVELSANYKYHSTSVSQFHDRCDHTKHKSTQVTFNNCLPCPQPVNMVERSTRNE